MRGFLVAVGLLASSCTGMIPDELLPPEPLPSPMWSGPAVPREDGQWAYTEPGDLPEVLDAQGQPLPLLHTAVAASLVGHVGHVTVRQTFRAPPRQRRKVPRGSPYLVPHDENRLTGSIEVLYVFPLPENAAVSGLKMEVEDRVIEARILSKRAARATYHQAKVAGHTASLLEQERPNVFTQSLVNVPRGEEITVEIEYLQTLTYDAGQYEFVFPMVIGPRFDSGAEDHDRVSPSVIGAGTRRGDDFTIEVAATAAKPITSWSVPTHDAVASGTDRALRIKLREADRLPNRDFVFRYRAATPKARATLFTGPRRAGTGRYALVVHPPSNDVDALVGRREFIFVVDASGSMSGEPLAHAKAAIRTTLLGLRPVDTFNVVSFASSATRLYARPRVANATNIQAALNFVDTRGAGGGTRMKDAVEAALNADLNPGRNRYVMFVTDGFVDNEAEICDAAMSLVERVASAGQRARVFAVGIGSSPNRVLIDYLSASGRGVPLYIVNEDDRARAVEAFARYTDHAVVRDLHLEPGSLQLEDQRPGRLGDLFASRPVTAFGTYSGDLDESPTVIGTIAGERIEIPVDVVRSPETHRVLETLWARAAVRDLEPRVWASRRNFEARDLITRIGLSHHIVTEFTSLVAVDTSRVVHGESELVVEPTLVPRGVESPPLARGDASYSMAMIVPVSEFVDENPRVANLRLPLRGRNWTLRPRVLFGLASGSRSAGVTKALRGQRARLGRCYQRSPKFDRYAWHRLRLRLAYSSDGRVEPTFVAGTVTKAADRCMLRILKRTRWPTMPPGSAVEISVRLSSATGV